jgi:hypothetical protein
MNPAEQAPSHQAHRFFLEKEPSGVVVVKTPSVLLLATLVLPTIGCKSQDKSLFISENLRSVTTWDNFDQAEAAFQKIIPHQTRVQDLKALGFDPHTTPNIKILNYLDIIERFIPNSSITKDDLHPDVRSCIELKEGCMGYELDLDIIRKRRFGNLALDMTGFRKETQIYGWDYKALLLIKDGVVVYKLRSGRPSIDKIERKIKPLGPVQEIDNLFDKIPGL